MKLSIVIKNLMIHIILIPFYILTVKEIALMPVDKLDTLLLFVGLIVIAPITSNFMYTYKDTTDKRSFVLGG